MSDKLFSDEEIEILGIKRIESSSKRWRLPLKDEIKKDDSCYVQESSS